MKDGEESTYYIFSNSSISKLQSGTRHKHLWKLKKLYHKGSNSSYELNKKGEIDRETAEILLVQVALEAAVPFRVGSGEGEAGEELGDRAGRRGPVHLSESIDQILRRDVAPIHRSKTYRTTPVVRSEP